MIRLIVAAGSRVTGNTLTTLLRERGVEVARDNRDLNKITGIVSYGCHLGQGKQPALNRFAGGITKFAELATLRKAGVRVPDFWTSGTPIKTLLQNRPLLARRDKHKGGRDIRYTTSERWIRSRIRMGWGFFTKFIPSRTEYRIWVYWRRHLGTYEKVKVRNVRWKSDTTHFGRGHKNGYAFQLVAPVPDRVRPAIELAIRSIAALKLDFGAVDVLEGNDRRMYVLEVNTAPGVEGPRQGINKLADRIANWVKKGYPKKKGEEDAE